MRILILLLLVISLDYALAASPRKKAIDEFEAKTKISTKNPNFELEFTKKGRSKDGTLYKLGFMNLDKTEMGNLIEQFKSVFFLKKFKFYEDKSKDELLRKTRIMSYHNRFVVTYQSDLDVWDTDDGKSVLIKLLKALDPDEGRKKKKQFNPIKRKTETEEVVGQEMYNPNEVPKGAKPGTYAFGSTIGKQDRPPPKEGYKYEEELSMKRPRSSKGPAFGSSVPRSGGASSKRDSNIINPRESSAKTPRKTSSTSLGRRSSSMNALNVDSSPRTTPKRSSNLKRMEGSKLPVRNIKTGSQHSLLSSAESLDIISETTEIQPESIQNPPEETDTSKSGSKSKKATRTERSKDIRDLKIVIEQNKKNKKNKKQPFQIIFENVYYSKEFIDVLFQFWNLLKGTNDCGEINVSSIRQANLRGPYFIGMDYNDFREETEEISANFQAGEMDKTGKVIMAPAEFREPLANAIKANYQFNRKTIVIFLKAIYQIFIHEVMSGVSEEEMGDQMFNILISEESELRYFENDKLQGLLGDRKARSVDDLLKDINTSEEERENEFGIENEFAIEPKQATIVHVGTEKEEEEEEREDTLEVKRKEVGTEHGQHSTKQYPREDTLEVKRKEVGTEHQQHSTQLYSQENTLAVKPKEVGTEPKQGTIVHVGTAGRQHGSGDTLQPVKRPQGREYETKLHTLQNTLEVVKNKESEQSETATKSGQYDQAGQQIGSDRKEFQFIDNPQVKEKVQLIRPGKYETENVNKPKEGSTEVELVSTPKRRTAKTELTSEHTDLQIVEPNKPAESKTVTKRSKQSDTTTTSEGSNPIRIEITGPEDADTSLQPEQRTKSEEFLSSPLKDDKRAKSTSDLSGKQLGYNRGDVTLKYYFNPNTDRERRASQTQEEREAEKHHVEETY